MSPAGQSRRLRRPRQLRTPGGALAALPTEIQDDVLGRLPARDVVRTSALSSVWRTRWESVRDLDVDLNLVGVRSWRTAVGVLERCAAPVRSVVIHGVPPRLVGRADGWLRLAAVKNPSSISLELPQTAAPPAAALPALFDCNPAVLAHLWLGSCALPAPPVGFAGFHALERLVLYRIFFLADNAGRQVEEMLTAAPGLQELSLKGVVFHVADGSFPAAKWVIGGPSLRRLVLCLSLAGVGPWELGALPKLEYAEVCLNDAPSDRDYAKLFNALSNVQKLKINHFGPATLQGPAIILKSHSPGTFENLRVLKLDTNFSVLSTYVSTYYLLSRAPLLQVLEIKDYIRDGIINEVNLVAGCMLTTLGSSTTLLQKLEYLRMISISCSENDMYFIKYALHNSRYLQKVSVDIFERSQKPCQEVYRELNECPRASTAARIIIKHGDSVCNV